MKYCSAKVIIRRQFNKLRRLDTAKTAFVVHTRLHKLRRGTTNISHLWLTFLSAFTVCLTSFSQARSAGKSKVLQVYSTQVSVRSRGSLPGAAGERFSVHSISHRHHSGVARQQRCGGTTGALCSDARWQD